MKARYITSIILACLCTSAIHAQQLPYFNHVFYNMATLNPSSSGMQGNTDLTLIQKNTLIGLPESPKTLMINLQGPMVSGKSGLGFSLFNESLGITSKTAAYGTYAYRVQFEEGHGLQFGMSVGVFQFSVDPDMATLDNPNDPLLLNKNFKSSAFDGSFGLTYVNRNFQLGLTAMQALAGKVNLADDVNFKLEQNFVASVQYRLFLNERKSVSITPIIIARYAQSTLPQDIMLSLNIRDKLWLVPSYNSNGAVGMAATAFLYDKLSVGYAYEAIVRQPVQGQQNGGHEILLGYRFNNHQQSFKRQQEEIDKLSTELQRLEARQATKDSMQDAQIKEGDDANAARIDEAKKDIAQTKADLDKLRKELIEAGVIREFPISEYDNAPAGYYIVIASVKNTRYNAEAMEAEYLSKGYKKVYNKVRGWHYVYTVRLDDFSEALSELKKIRATAQKDAWIHILK